MKAIGLHPSATGEPGGRETGDRMDHYVIENGPFMRVARTMVAQGFSLPWARASGTLNAESPAPVGSKSGKRVKYVCPAVGCVESARARHGANLDCGVHKRRLIPAP